MRDHDLSTDRQSQTTSAAIGGAAGIEPGEPLEHSAPIFGTDDLAVIINRDHNVAGTALHPDDDR